MRRRTFDILLSAAGLILVAALAAFIGAGLLLILSVIGIIHSRRVAQTEELLAPKEAAATA